jgi:hypothetical protein
VDFYTDVKKRFVLNGSERTESFSKRNILHFVCRAVAAQQLAVAMERERTNLLARRSGKTTARPPVFVCRSKQVHHQESGLRDF